MLIAVLLMSLTARADGVAFDEHTLEIHEDRSVPRIVGMTSEVYINLPARQRSL